MPKRYGFAPEECISIHPSILDSIQCEFWECLAIFYLLMDYVYHRAEVDDELPGLYQTLEMLHSRMEAGVHSLDPDALTDRMAKVPAIVEGCRCEH